MSALTADDVSTVAQHLFKRFAHEMKIPPDDFPKLSPVAFLDWLRDTPLTTIETQAQLGVPLAACDYVFKMAYDAAGPNRLIAMWPYIILKHRTMKHELESMQLFLVLKWSDGVVAPLAVLLHKDLTDGEELTDATVCSTVTTYSQSLTNQVLEDGLNAIHDEKKTNGLFGSERIVQLAQDLVNGVVDRRVVPDSEMAAVNQLLLFVASMFPDGIPDELKEQVRLRRVAEAEAAKQSEGFKGGFDQG